MQRSLQRSFLAVVLTVTCVPPAIAVDYSNLVFFGDSLTDSGTYVSEPPIAGLFPIEGRFTTNPGPVWAEHLGSRFGLQISPANQGGSNYAAGGARVSAQPGYPNSPLVPFIQDAASVADQITGYLAGTPGQADADTLYSVWAGANDLFALQDGDADYSALPMDQVGASLADQIARLHAAGARQLLVLNLPDIGVTPGLIADGPVAQAQATIFAQNFNRSLYSSLAAQGIAVIPIDIYAVLDFQIANAAALGISNTTGQACAGQPSSLVCGVGDYVAGTDQTFTFADGVHPTSGIHSILAQYIAGILAAPRQVALMADSSLSGRDDLHALLRRQSASAAFADRDGGVWVYVQGSALERDDLANDPGFDDDSYRLALGTDFQLGENWIIGVSLSGSESDADYGFERGDFSVSDVSLGVSGHWRQGNLYAYGAVAYGETDFTLERSIVMADTAFGVRGDTDGSTASAELQLGYNIGLPAAKTGPYVGLLAQQLRIDGFEERGADALRMGFGRQERHVLLASLGWQAQFQFSRVHPFVRLSVDRNLEDNQHSLQVMALSIPEALPYNMPAQGPERTRYSAEAGISSAFAESFNFTLGAAGHFGQDERNAWHIYGGLEFDF